MNQRMFLRIAWLLAVIGIGLLLASAYFYRADRRIESNGAIAPGSVVGFKEGVAYRNPGARNRDEDPNNRYRYRYPEITFTTTDGKTLRLTAPRHYESYELEIGDRIDVVYLRSKPDQAEIKGTRRLSDSMWITGIVGMASLLPLLLGVLLPELLRRWRLP